jgi:hypothetical protein
MRVKCPGEIVPGDRIWLWRPRGWVTVTRVQPRRNETAMVGLNNGSTIEIYTKRIMP